MELENLVGEHNINGLFFGNWGKCVSIIGVHSFEIYSASGSRICWIEDILEMLEIEKDLEAEVCL